MQRFKPKDAVFILPKYARLYPGNSAVVISASASAFRPMFNAYAVEFPDRSTYKLLEFQIIDDVPNFETHIASLVFDSRYQAATAQTRGSHSGCQIILQTPRFDVDMMIRTTESGASITGQILERDAKGLLKGPAEVRWMHEGMPITSTMSDTDGVFGFKDVRRGSSNILIVLGQYSARVLGAVTI
jgi:hypothetical protein